MEEVGVSCLREQLSNAFYWKIKYLVHFYWYINEETQIICDELYKWTHNQHQDQDRKHFRYLQKPSCAPHSITHLSRIWTVLTCKVTE